MEPYGKIHLHDFPPTTYVHIEENYRKHIFNKLSHFFSLSKLSSILNEKSTKYDIHTKINAGNIFYWKVGIKKDRNKVVCINIPLWALIEISQILPTSMEEIEKNVDHITTTGRGIEVKIRFPLFLTPELVSIIFHLSGDGHIGVKGDCSHYRQVNQIGLNNVLLKLQNSFGEFEVNKEQLAESKLIIPKVITNFYQHYFNLNSCYWDVARIPEETKQLSKTFLVAGLNAFIIDEGHIGDKVEIYSGNQNLLQDIHEIAVKLGYKCFGPRIKLRYGMPNCYVMYISADSAEKYYTDIQEVKNKFPTCGLAHKEHLLENIVKRRNRENMKTAHGESKAKIVSLVNVKERTANELAEILNISLSSTREHLCELEALKRIRRAGKGKHAILWAKIAEPFLHQ